MYQIMKEKVDEKCLKRKQKLIYLTTIFLNLQIKDTEINTPYLKSLAENLQIRTVTRLQKIKLDFSFVFGEF